MTKMEWLSEQWALCSPDACLIWTGASAGPRWREGKGYPQMTVEGKHLRPHVLACEHRNGSRPKGMSAAHECGVSMCVNPYHLSWKTTKKNHADKLRHGTLIRGEASPDAKLTEADVRVIRSSTESQTELARQFGVHHVTIHDIVRCRTWKHVA